MRPVMAVFGLLLFLSSAHAADIFSNTLLKEGEKETLKGLSLRIHWLGVTHYGAATGDWEPPVTPSGDLLTSDNWEYYPDNLLESSLTMKAAYLLASGRFDRFYGRVLLDFMNERLGPVDELFLEFSPFNSPRLQKLLSLRVGQFLLPFTWRQTQFPYELLRPRYSQTVEYLFLNGTALREPALMLFGTKKLFGLNIRYQGFVSNGQMQNCVVDTDERKAFGLRGEALLSGGFLQKLKMEKMAFGVAYMDAGRLMLPQYLPYQAEYLARQRLCVDARFRGRLLRKSYHLYLCYINGSEDLRWFEDATSTWVLERNRGVDGMAAELAIWLWENRKIDPKRVPLEEMRWRPYGLALVLWWDSFSMTNYRMFKTTGKYRRAKHVYAVGVLWDIRWYVKLQAFVEIRDFGRYYGGKYLGIDDFGKWRLSVQLAFVAF